MQGTNKQSKVRRRKPHDAEDMIHGSSAVDKKTNPEQKPEEEGHFVHGQVYFSQDVDEMSEFMVVPSDAEVQDVLGQFKCHWNLSAPRVALFVISDPGRRFAWKDAHNMSALVSGLVNALNTIEMWIFTNGLNAGIAMEIGRGFRAELLKRHEAFFSHFESEECLPGYKHLSYPEVALIGACDYNSLTYARELIKSKRPIRLQNGRYICTEETYDLDSNHTHFLVIKGKDPTDVHDLLFKIADKMARCFEHHSESRFTTSGATYIRISEVSVVALLLQGGLKALDFIRKHLERKLPLVVVKGSGGIADLLAYTYYEVQHMPGGSDPAEYSEKVLKYLICVKAVSIFPSLEKSSFAQISVFEKLLQCVRFGSQKESDLLTVLDTTQRSRLDRLPHHLLKALFKCKPAITPSVKREIYMRQDLHLAMDWNSPLIAMEEVLAKGTDVISTIDEQLFIRALLKPHREGFVEMFLQQGFQVYKILTSKMLILLFNASIEEDFFRNVILKGMMGQDPDITITEDFIDHTLGRFIEKVTGLRSFIRAKDLDYSCKKNVSTLQKDEAEEKALVILIIWAICTYRVNLLKSIWTNSRQPIRLAIFISMMLKQVNEQVYEVSVKNDLKKHHVMFSKMGTDVLDMYYKDVPTQALNFVQEKSSVWCYKTVMEIAAFARNKHFLAHPCCQRYLNSKFMGQIRIKSKQSFFSFPIWLKILLSAFLIFPMYIWISYYVSVDKFAEGKIGEKNVDSKYKRRKFLSLKSPTSENDVGAKKTNYFADDTDPNAYFYGPIFHLKQIYPNLLDKIYYMWTAPITKFWIYHFSYLFYLLYFGSVLLYPSCGHYRMDMALFVWTIMIFIESAYLLHKKYRSYSIKWDVLQVIIFVCFLVVFGLNRVITFNKYMTSYDVKLVMSFIMIFLYYRYVWSIMPISSTLGPLLYRVKRMLLVDFRNLIYISVLFMVSNVIVLLTLLHPDAALGKDRFLKISKYSFDMLFRTPTVDHGHENANCVASVEHDSKHPCKAGRYENNECENAGIWPWFFFIQFVTPFKWVLIPTLYMLFSATHKKLQEESNEIWKFQRYKLVMEFQERMLPLPFSLISYIYIFGCYLCNCCRIDRKHRSPPQEAVETFSTFSHQDSTYFLYLFKKHCNTFESEENCKQKIVRQEIEMMSALGEGLRQQKTMVTELESKLMDLQTGLNYMNKYLLHKPEREKLETKSSKKIPQKLSRQNPYPHTQIKRYPVPDNRVSWEIEWFTYDPVAYTLSKEYFDSELREFVDEDLHLWMQTYRGETSKPPKYLWNQAVTSAAGLFVDRQSWIVGKDGKALCYVIDFEGLPRNPLGRTGLRGKGFLPRWGPNHYMYAFITSWFSTSSGQTDQLRFVARCKQTEQEGEQTTLPGGFLTSSKMYNVVQQYFITKEIDGSTRKWDSYEDMISYFKTCLLEKSENFSIHNVNSIENTMESNETIDDDIKPDSIEYRCVTKGYMDDPLNTDQAWLELELWHIHFKDETDLEVKFNPGVYWEFLDEQALEKMQKGLVVFIKNIAQSMNATL